MPKSRFWTREKPTMLPLYRTLSLRYLSRRWFRALLIVASIALGVATLVATRALNETMSKAALTSANPMAGITDLVVSNGEMPIARALADEIAKVSGVQSVRARLFENVHLPEHGNKSVLVMGIDILAELKDVDTAKDDVKLGPGVFLAYMGLRLTPRTPVILGKGLADDLPTDTKVLKVRKNQLAKPHELTLAGYVEAGGDAAALGGYVLILDLEAAGEILDLRKGQVNRLDIVLHPKVRGSADERQKVRTDIDKVLAGRAGVRTPEEQNQSLQSVMAGMQTGFSLCGIAALVVGLFLVYNSLSVSVAERRHEIGILLSLGATRDQVRRLFAGEAIALGLTGSILGIPLGLGLAQLGLAPMQDILNDLFFKLDARQVEVSTGLVIVSLLVGVTTAVAAALVPAIQASQENPAEAVRRVAKAPTVGKLLVHVLISLSMVVVGLVLILFRAAAPYRLGAYGGMVLVLLGALVASPFFAALAARLVQPLVRRFLGIEWRLAADNLVRSPGRTGLVIGALAAGVSLVVQTAGTIRSNRLALRDWIQDSIGADLVISAGSPVGAGGQNLFMDAELAQDIKKLSSVETALPTRNRKVPYRGKQINITAVEAAQVSAMEKKRLSNANDAHLFNAMSSQPNSVIASGNFAALYGVRKGDSVTLPSPKGELKLLVMGIVVDYSWHHGSLLMNRQDYLRAFDDDKVDFFDVYLKTGGDPLGAKQAILSKFGAQYGLYVLTRHELQERIDGMVERLYGIAYGQLIVVMLVAALGVVMALLISVLHKRREMGLLRAIGASRPQVIRSVLAEACLMGIIGTVIGLLVGIPLQWYVLNVLILEESGYLFPVYIPWVGGLIIAAAAMITATLAGLGPAMYAVRQRIPEAIAYE
jgi:putative ABC transport system permease protein